MINKKYTTPLLGFVGIMCAMTWTIAGTVASVIILLMVIDQMLLDSRYTRRIYQKLILRNPFRVECPSEIKATPSEQDIEATVYINSRMSIRYIQILFKESEKSPEITKLYDWYRMDKGLSSNIDAHQATDGSWIWTYASPWSRTRGKRITIGIKLKATQSFEGTLIFRLTPEQSDESIAKELHFLVKDNK